MSYYVLSDYVSIAIGITLAGAPAIAQTTQAGQATQSGQPTQTAQAARAEAQSRYQIGQMERVLEGAVEHGAALTRDRLKAVLPPGDTLMSGENARVRGFRLDGYGVFFDVAVPPFETETTLAWSVRTLDQNDLGLDSAMRQLQAYVKNSGDTNLEQALRRVELQVTPTLGRPLVDAGQAGQAGQSPQGQSAPVGVNGIVDARTVTGSTQAVKDAPSAPNDPILSDPNEAYRTEVVQALKDAMLDHSASLDISANEWLTIAARGITDRPRLAPADSDDSTRILRLHGSDLAAYLARQITREEADQRIEVRVF